MSATAKTSVRFWREHPACSCGLPYTTDAYKHADGKVRRDITTNGAYCRVCWLMDRRIYRTDEADRFIARQRWAGREAEANEWEVREEDDGPRPEWGRPLGDLDTVTVPSIRDTGLGLRAEAGLRERVKRLAGWRHMRPNRDRVTYEYVSIPWDVLTFGSTPGLPGDDVARLVGEDNEAAMLAAREQGVRDVIDVLDNYGFYWPDYADESIGEPEFPF